MNMHHEFVEYIPEEISDGILYVSIPYGTVVHKCACGCGEEVVTPLGPAEWKFTYNGKTISLYPSVGNWSFACRSHYWISESEVQWARAFSMEEVLEARKKAKQLRKRMYGPISEAKRDTTQETTRENRFVAMAVKLWKRMWKR